MATYKNTLVTIPIDKGVHIKSAGAKGEQYVYKYLKYFRNSEGKPRNKAISIGKVDPQSGKMYPNDNYFAMFNQNPMLPDSSVWDYGYTYLVLKICRDLKLIDCLSKSFGEIAMDIIAMAAYIIREGNAMDGIDDWLERNYFSNFDHLLTSQSTSRIFASLSETQMNHFFKQWVQTAFDGGSVCYDVTSISSYSNQMPAVERGYNRDGDDLNQYNLGMFCDETTKTPLYYNRYNGSLTDKTNLSYVLKNAKSVGIHNVKMILDGGFWSEECIKTLHASCKNFTVGMPMYLKEAEKILDEYGSGIDKYVNELSNYHVYCIPVNTFIYGVPGRVLVYYDAGNRNHLCNEMSSRIGLLQSELSTLKRYPKSKINRYTTYFTLIKHENDSGFDYAINADKIEKLRKNKGYFLLFSTDLESTPSDILYYYRAKDADEKIFAQIKVDMDGGRIRTHNEATTDGKTFVTFIACIIRSYMLSRLMDYLTENSTSMKKIVNQLSNITLISDSNGFRFTKALTKKQKAILSAFGAADDIIGSLN